MAGPWFSRPDFSPAHPDRARNHAIRMAMKLSSALCFVGLANIVVAGDFAEIKVLLPGDKPQEGIQITDGPTFSVREAKPQDFRFTVVNLFEDEIFLEVTNFADVGISVRGDGFSAGGGGTVTGFPDNTNLLKRLHRSSKAEDGSFVSCGCSMVSISGAATVPAGFLSRKGIEELRKAGFTIDLTFTGYFRETGQQFFGSVELPVKIMEFEQAAAPEAPPPAGRGGD